MTSFTDNIPNDRINYIMMLSQLLTQLEWLCFKNDTTLDLVLEKMFLSKNLEVLTLHDISSIITKLDGELILSCSYQGDCNHV